MSDLPDWHPGFGPIPEPTVGVIYGDYGIGKTLDLMRCFGWSAGMMGPKGGNIPARSVLGFEPPAFVEVMYLDQGIEQLDMLLQVPAEQRPFAILYDDLTVQSENQHQQDKPDDLKGDRTFGWWGGSSDKMSLWKQYAIALGVHFWATAHRSDPGDKEHPKTKKLEFHKGGPKLAGPSMAKKLPNVFSIVIRADTDEKRGVKAKNGDYLFWKGQYECTPGRQWHDKDRWNVFYPKGPMNLREHLRLRGVPLPRPEGFEDLDQIADAFVAQLEAEVAAGSQGALAGASPKKAGGFKKPEVENDNPLLRATRIIAPQLRDLGYAENTIRWALQDGRDRFDLAHRGSVLDV